MTPWPRPASPPTLALEIGQSHYSTPHIDREGCFSVNIPSSEQVVGADYCGLVSGRVDPDKPGTCGWTMAPATLMLVAHVEQDGVWLIEGGMYALSAALGRQAQKLGVEIRYDEGIDAVFTQRGRVTGVRTDKGEELRSENVIFNGDVSALPGLLEPQKRLPTVKPGERSLSASRRRTTACRA